MQLSRCNMNAEWRVTPLILNVARPVGKFRSTRDSSVCTPNVCYKKYITSHRISCIIKDLPTPPGPSEYHWNPGWISPFLIFCTYILHHKWLVITIWCCQVFSKLKKVRYSLFVIISLWASHSNNVLNWFLLELALCVSFAPICSSRSLTSCSSLSLWTFCTVTLLIYCLYISFFYSWSNVVPGYFGWPILSNVLNSCIHFIIMHMECTSIVFYKITTIVSLAR